MSLSHSCARSYGVWQSGGTPPVLLNLDTRWGKNYPVTGVEGPLRFQEVEASRSFRQVAYQGGKVARYKHRPPSPPPHPRGDPWYSFLLEAETTVLMKNTNGPIGKIIRVLPACSAVPQTNYTTTYPIQVVPVAHGATKYCSLTAVIGRQPVFSLDWATLQILVLSGREIRSPCIE